MRQADFGYGRELVVMRWRFGWLTVRWESGVWGVFQSWDAALSCVLHPLNDNVTLRIRA